MNTPSHRFDYNSKGVGLVAVLVVILILVMLGGAGFYVYQRDHNARTSNDATSSIQRNQNTNRQQSNQQYLTIREWAIKVPLSESIKDAYYTPTGSNLGTDGLPNTAWLGLTSLNSSGCDISSSGRSSTAAPIGSIFRVAPTDRDPVSGELYTKQYPNGVTLGAHYYVYTPWKSQTCASQTTVQSINSAFTDAVKKAMAQ